VGEVYVVPAQLEFRAEIGQKDKINLL
jgi:hypothetical protein